MLIGNGIWDLKRDNEIKPLTYINSKKLEKDNVTGFACVGVEDIFIVKATQTLCVGGEQPPQSGSLFVSFLRGPRDSYSWVIQYPGVPERHVQATR